MTDDDKKYLTTDEFASKISWEGGILEGLDYGLKSSQLDPADESCRDLRAAWSRLEDLHEEMRLAIDVVEEELQAVEDAGTDG